MDENFESLPLFLPLHLNLKEQMFCPDAVFLPKLTNQALTRDKNHSNQVIPDQG